MTSHPIFEIVTTTAGAVSIRHKQINEIMHNPVGPWKESNELYIEQSRLKTLLTQDLGTELVIYDVGLGAAANAIAALHATLTQGADTVSKKRRVRIVSFEIDLSLLEFALEHSRELGYLVGYECALDTLLEKKYYETEHLIWDLRVGDFLETIENVESLCHLIYYDPYSPKLNEAMWTTACFKKLRAKCAERAMFYNYSQATTIRAALLEAGFYVGYGKPTGLKNNTTQASTLLKDLTNPLDQRWLQRWQRSNTPLPIDCTDADQFKHFILNHEQFRN